MLLVQPPELAQRDGSGVSGEAELREAPRELEGLLFGERPIPVA
jgi:hypothetical protein